MDNQEEIVKDLVEVTFPEKDDFLKIRETLSRIGVARRREQELFQSCHILHKRGKYYITHFNELFKLDGKPSNIDESDIGRRNTIVGLLQQWNLVSVVNKQQIEATYQQAVQTFQKWEASWQFYKEEALPLAKEQRKGALLAYKEGAVDYAAFTQLMRDAIQTEMDALDALHNYLQSVFQLHYFNN